MSDAQSILIILLLFYFVECIKFAPIGSFSIRSAYLKKGQWRLQSHCLELHGAKKTVFLAPLLPWPQVQLITQTVGESKHQACSVKQTKEVEAKLEWLQSESALLRHLSLLIFINYFILLPLIYLKFGEGSYIYSGVGSAYLLQATTMVVFHIKHRKLLPEERGQRWLHSFYCLILPWHAMRAADEFFLKTCKDWSELAILGALAQSTAASDQLKLYSRQAKYLKSSPYRLETLSPILQKAEIQPAANEHLRHTEVGLKYCPCCLGAYELSAHTCMDCQGVELRQPTQPTL